jgi:hypothetical protein
MAGIDCRAEVQHGRGDDDDDAESNLQHFAADELKEEQPRTNAEQVAAVHAGQPAVVDVPAHLQQHQHVHDDAEDDGGGYGGFRLPGEGEERREDEGEGKTSDRLGNGGDKGDESAEECCFGVQRPKPRPT